MRNSGPDPYRMSGGVRLFISLFHFIVRCVRRGNGETPEEGEGLGKDK